MKLFLDEGNSQSFDQSIFQDVSENISEEWDWGVLVGGMAEEHDAAAIARAYKIAGDILTSEALNDGEAYEIAYPILFMYRHALELYLKAVVQPQKLNHSMNW